MHAIFLELFSSFILIGYNIGGLKIKYYMYNFNILLSLPRSCLNIQYITIYSLIIKNN